MYLITFNDTHIQKHTHLVALPWTRDRSVAEAFTSVTPNTHKRQTSIPPGGIRARNPSKGAAEDPRLRPRGHRNRQKENLKNQIHTHTMFEKTQEFSV